MLLEQLIQTAYPKPKQGHHLRFLCTSTSKSVVTHQSMCVLQLKPRTQLMGVSHPAGHVHLRAVGQLKAAWQQEAWVGFSVDL